jgi:hypothetical protein
MYVCAWEDEEWGQTVVVAHAAKRLRFGAFLPNILTVLSACPSRDQHPRMLSSDDVVARPMSYLTLGNKFNANGIFLFLPPPPLNSAALHSESILAVSLIP